MSEVQFAHFLIFSSLQEVLLVSTESIHALFFEIDSDEILPFANEGRSVMASSAPASLAATGMTKPSKIATAPSDAASVAPLVCT